ncbi:MAG: adenosylmethionine decarboxylase [Phycisphaerae bacterium]|nr:adenosylmethionine decarboxylase [Phycisphaerae bacterium]
MTETPNDSNRRSAAAPSTRDGLIAEHAIVDLFDVAPTTLTDRDSACAAIEAALLAAGMRIIDQKSCVFANGGFTAVFLLAESHASVHSYPERGFVAVDVMSCAHRPTAEIVRRIRDYFAPQRTEVRVLNRGEPSTAE